ncbi:MAG TPA: NAD+ synthase [Gemmatimonadaceae bacterium]|nr:NAD+ synthase [Gemmatimonadaceae bacterium]
MSKRITIALGQLRPRKGDVDANIARLGELFAQINQGSERPDVLHLPETVLSGYFVEGGVADVALTAGRLAARLNETYRAANGNGRGLDLVIGFYERWRDTLHNSAMYVRLGESQPSVLHVHRKVFLPTYGLFDEERFVERGLDVRAFDTPWGRAAILICEDAWHSMTGTLAALDDAQVIFISSAAPARGIHPRDDGIEGPATMARWERLLRDLAEEHGVFVTFSNLVGSEGGKVFAGGSLIVGPKGDVVLRARVWDEALTSTTIDLADLTRARAELPLLADLRSVAPHMQENLRRVTLGEPVRLDYEEDTAQASAVDGGGVRSHGDGALRWEHSAKGQNAGPSLNIDPALVEKWLVMFIRDEMSRRGFKRAVVGMSGGVDSAVTAALAARALGAENVVGVRMPYRTSSPESLQHAQLVIDALGIAERTVDISGAVDGYLALEPEADPRRRGNVMARTRMIVLFDLSAKIHGIPLGTGNKSERLLGYFTWHADDAPPINPLGDLFKTQVWQLARHLGIPDVIVDKPASADLIAGQTDEADFGISYEIADRILAWLVAGYRPSELVARGFDQHQIQIVTKRLEGTHWKRKLPTVAMLSQTAIGESYLRPVDY